MNEILENFVLESLFFILLFFSRSNFLPQSYREQTLCNKFLHLTHSIQSSSLVYT